MQQSVAICCIIAIFLESQKPALNFPRARAGLGLPKYKETIHIKEDYFYGKACERRQQIYPRLSTSFEWFWHHATAVGYPQLLWWGFWGRARAWISNKKTSVLSLFERAIAPIALKSSPASHPMAGAVVSFPFGVLWLLAPNECWQAADWTAFLTCPLFKDVMDSISQISG